ncbi:BEL1-like homeodomain protein 11 [Diospyros lotus]|uniref:BEL1-like homeodomain protein 11 n=1 Tax=Diospyros lotus TaxID=55363 RepID=UPI002252B00E|nr:BEL1-like homeodomain protein 11 [Diospyros lotus]
MVSQDSPPNPSSSVLHQFIISDSMASHPFQNQHFDACRSDPRGSGMVHHSQGQGVYPSVQCLGERMSRALDLVQAPPLTGESPISHCRHLIDLLGSSNETHHQPQRLTLSLGSDMLVPPVQFRSRISPSYFISGEEEAREACHNPRRDSLACSASYGAESFAIAVGNSKYLNQAQSLLEEVVSVACKAVDLRNEKFIRRLSRHSRRGSLRLCSELKHALPNDGLSPEKHDLQIKILKLISLLEEVERRYEHYCHQLEEVVSSFEMIAGAGAGKSYTALALQAMSRRFCSLRDAITSQILAGRHRISDDIPKFNPALSQLSLFDRETGDNQLSSLQQLGMMQSQRQAWRPIRGLPDTSVAILRSWLFEHFLHPYPNDSEKLMLASQTGLTKNQVSNWFINARVRLWKPMIEEMYKEEFADSSADSDPLLASGSLPGECVTDTAEE